MGYVDSAIERELDILRGTQPGNQDNQINASAFKLAQLVKAGADEAPVRSQFFDAVQGLPSKGKPWTRQDAEKKWRRAMREAQPRQLPVKNGAAGRSWMADRKPETKTAPPKASLSPQGVPKWTAPTEEFRYDFVIASGAGEGPAKIDGEIRRHLYRRAGHAVRAKIKYKKNGRPSWLDIYQVAIGKNRIGWQFKRPVAYVECPYFAEEFLNPFDPEFFGERLYQTEGEKDADSFARQNACAFSMGASSIVLDCSEFVHDRDLVILGDNDEAGRKFSEKQAALSIKAARSVKVYTFPDLPEGGDVSDFLETRTLADLEAILEKTPYWQDPEFPSVDFGSLMRMPDHERLWLVPDWMPWSELVLFGGDGGTGKSTLALQLAIACAYGRPWLGIEVRKCDVLYLAAEDDIKELRYRAGKLAHHMAIANPGRELEFLLMAGKNAILAIPSPEGGIMATPFFERLEEVLAQRRPGLLVLDSSADVYGASENDRTQVRSFTTLLRSLAEKYECTIILLCHPSVDALKTGRGYSGSTHWNNASRSRIYLRFDDTEEEGEEPDADVRILELPKANRGVRGLRKRLRWRDDEFIIEGAADNIGQQIECEELFLELMDSLHEEGFSLSPHRSNRFAPALMHKRNLKFKISEYEHAMHALLSTKKIKLVVEGKGTRTRERLSKC